MSEGSKVTVKTNAGKQGDTQNRSEKTNDIRTTNIQAAKAVADVIRTSLGPRGMDKMIQDAKGQVLITNDGATILKQMDVIHPTAKMLVEISKAQDIEAGDGTTSVVVIAGALLHACEALLARGIHPTTISEGFQIALDEALKVLKSISTTVDLKDRDALITCVNTALSSKVISTNSQQLSPIAVDAVLKIIDTAKDTNADLRDIKVVKKLGGTIEDTELIEGLVFTNQKPSQSAGGPSRIKDAKIALIQFCLSSPKTEVENSVVVKDYTAMDRILKEERKYIANLVSKIVKSGANVVLIQKSILRDATNELSLHFLAKKGIMVVKDIEREDVEFITKTIGAIPVAHIDHLTPEKLGKAELCEDVKLSDDSRILKITGVQSKAKTVTILCRGSNSLVIDEAERSLHDALCVVRSLVKNRGLVPGGGVPEVEISQQLSKLSREMKGVNSLIVRAFADALEVIPYTLAENAGLNPINIVTDLRNRHALGHKYAGISIRKGTINDDITTESVLQPALVTQSALTLATECVRMILKIDDLVFSAR
uniref:T-complex protein 1 subunit delta n=1 Tax=Tetrahymena pyriformis TaxID=5908 RepID=Q7YZF2_TETPY|nr:CCT delta subunit [Tetrahymena pyriformis]